MPGKNTRRTGSEMEKIAAGYLAAQGVRILESNFRTREAEIDLIGRQGRTLLFVEVKARRKNGKSGTGAEAVGPAKQRRICRCADYYMRSGWRAGRTSRANSRILLMRSTGSATLFPISAIREPDLPGEYGDRLRLRDREF